MKKTKKTFEQEPSGVYKEKPCDKCGGTMSYNNTARIYLCNCGEEKEDGLEGIPTKLYSK